MAQRTIIQDSVHLLEVGYCGISEIDLRFLDTLCKFSGVLVQVV